MKTSFREIIETEKFLLKELSAEESLLFQAKLMLDESLRSNTFFHRIVHRMLTIYHRKKLKTKMEAIHQRLLNDPSKTPFRNQITEIFNR